MKENNYQKYIDELLALTNKALQYVEKRDISSAFMISNKRKKLLNKLKFIALPADDKVKADLENIREIDASISRAIETELSGMQHKVSLIKNELKFRDRFVSAGRTSRKIIDGKM